MTFSTPSVEFRVVSSGLLVHHAIGRYLLEDHLKSPVTRRRLRASLVAPHIDAFADWLHQHRYAAPLHIEGVALAPAR